MIKTTDYIYMADGSVKPANQVIIGDSLMAVDAAKNITFSTKCININTLEEDSLILNDMQISKLSKVCHETGYFTSPKLNANIYEFRGRNDHSIDIVYRYEDADKCEFIEIMTECMTYIAGPTANGPFFVFLGPLKVKEVG